MVTKKDDTLTVAQIELLLGRPLPSPDTSFDWRRVTHFVLHEGGTIQGYDGYNEPVGPFLEVSARMVSEEEALRRMQRGGL